MTDPNDAGASPEPAATVWQVVAHNVFAEPRPGEFALNDLATLLCSGHPSGMRVGLDLDGFGGQMDLAFTELLHTVRTGEPAWAEVFGAPFWDRLAADRAMSAPFDATMSCGGRERTAEQYADLAAAVGLDVAAVRTTPLGQLGIELVRRRGAGSSRHEDSDLP